MSGWAQREAENAEDQEAAAELRLAVDFDADPVSTSGSPAEWDRWKSAQVARGRCPYSGRELIACKRSQCDCFEFEEGK